MTTAPDLVGQHVLITGASSGIGAAAAVQFSALGATVGICARRSAGLEATAASCSRQTQVYRWAVDLSDLDGIADFAARVRADMGHVDVLVNNAGAGRRRKMQEITIGEFDATMALNFSSPMRLTLALLPHMIERNSGALVFVGSSGTREFAPTTGSYIAAKAALQSFAEALYIDLAATNVRSRLVIPGRTSTDFGNAKEGEEPPFPANPATTDSPDDVAAAILRSLGSDDFESFTNDRVRDDCLAKAPNPNDYLRTRRSWFR